MKSLPIDKQYLTPIRHHLALTHTGSSPYTAISQIPVSAKKHHA